MAGIRLQGVRKVFPGGLVAVDGLDLEVAEGEFLVLVGPSGCGKSTTLRLVAGLETPTEGRIFLGGEDVTDLPPRERDVAMVFQSYALYPHMTVFDNLAFALRMRRRPKGEIRERVLGVARILGLEGLLDRRPGGLSGGQRQRVALGRAIVREPRAFLFDEPLSNLDAKLRVGTRAELVRLHRRLGATILYVTHDQVEAMTMGERIAVMDRGRLQQVAPPGELYRRPATRFVAGFIGSPPMNLFPGVVEEGPAGPRFRGASFSLDLRPGWREGGPEGPRPGGGEVELGVRAEDLTLAAPGSGDFDAGVLVVEPLGSETLVHARSGAGEEVVVRVPGEATVRVEERIGVRLAPSRVHLFHRESGARIGGGGEEG